MVIKDSNKLIWKTAGETLVIESWGKNAFRVRSVVTGDITDTDYALIPQEMLKCDFRENDESVSITNGKITAEITPAASGWSIDHGHITFKKEDGTVLLEDIDRNEAASPHPRKFRTHGYADRSLTCRFKAYDYEMLYGMGQYQIETLNLKGHILELAQKNTQASIPFVISSRGYGFFWHNPAVGQATFGHNFTEWTAESSPQCDYWIVADDSPAAIQQAFAKVTGLPPMMPEYGLGFWQCKMRYWNQEQVLNIARKYKEKKIPIDVIIIDFFHWPKMGDYRFDYEFFPDPQAMVKELKDLGIELMVSVWTPVDYRSENYKEIADKNLLVQVEQGINITLRFFDGETIYLDVTNPDSRKFLWQKLRENYYKNGIHLFWLDEAEPGYMKYDFANYRYYAGSALEVGNIYPKLYTKTFYDGLQSEGRTDIVNLVRCAWAGSQRYGALVWSGDVASTWEAFRKQICAGLNIGLAGIPWWTTDIGGFHSGHVDDPSFKELLMRWFQWGAFCPVMRLHGDRLPHTIYKNKQGDEIMNEGAPNEVWSYGPELEAIFTFYIHLRELMRPYIRQLMKTAHETGSPIMRPMFYEFPDDENVWEIKDQYMFGSDVLVAPVLEPDTEARTVYLPKGTWQYLFSGDVFEGEQFVIVKTPKEEIPIFLKDKENQNWIDEVKNLKKQIWNNCDVVE